MTTDKTIRANAHPTNTEAVDKQSPSIADAMQAVEQLLHDIVYSDVDILRDASRHILGAGGKRIRPRLLLLSYLATGGTDLPQAAPVAAALELVHTASVVHDDINDHGTMRRGRPSINALWGRTLALLTGDFLFTKVYELMAPYHDLNVLFAQATIALVEGETLQAVAAKENNLSREVYYEIIARKTAALFRIGAMLGAKLSNATESTIEALAQYGYNVGLAFQIVDDILDLTGDDAQLGKTAGLDMSQGKGFAAVHDNGKDSNDDPMEALKQKIMAGNAIAEAQKQAQNLIQVAIATLDILPQSPHKAGLIDLAQMVVDRTS